MTPRPQVAAAVLLALMLVGCSRPPVRPTLALTGATVINVRDGTRTTDATVLIEDESIIRLGPAEDVSIPSHASVVAVGGKYVIPGLWDVHTHIQNVRELEVFIPLRIAHGIVGIRDMEGLLVWKTVVVRLKSGSEATWWSSMPTPRRRSRIRDASSQLFSVVI